MPIRPKRQLSQPSPSTPDATPAASPVTPSVGKAGFAARARVRALPHAAPAPATGSNQAAPLAKRAHHIVDRTTDNWDEDGNYVVGRGRPPKQHQWRKGQSGNPRGPKPAEKLDPGTAFDRALLSLFPAKVNGEEVMLSQGEFGLNILRSLAAKGNRQAASRLVDLYVEATRRETGAELQGGLSDDELAVIEAALEEAGFNAAPVRRRTDRTPSGEQPS